MDSRAFKHDLRTPLNHIIGFVELLMEEACEKGNTSSLPTLEAIHKEGAALSAVVDRTLPGSADVVSDSQLDDLQIGSRPAVERIIELSARQRPSTEEYTELLGKIGRAAARFADLLHQARMQ